MWNQPDAYSHLELKSNCFNVITGNQGITWSGEIDTRKDSDGNQCQSCEVYWLQDCLPEVKDCSETGTAADCEVPDGEEIGVGCATYISDCIGETTRKVSDLDCKNLISQEERAAQSQNGMMQAMDVAHITKGYQYMMSQADALTDGMFEYGGLDPNDPTNWILTEADLHAKFMACIRIFMTKCKYAKPMIISGESWGKIKIMLENKSGGGCCDSDQLITNTVPMKHDFIYFDETMQTNPKDKHFFLIDLNDFGFINTPCFENSNREKLVAKEGERYGYKIPSRALTWKNGTTIAPLYYDLEEFVLCDGKKKVKTTYRLSAQGNWMRAPRGCNTTCPKVIHFTVKG